ncbi:MAG: hypothetical protein IT378_24010 [Sandaracinaceae bacterium]|nr:hypothetical protein [Sandaracinaceae bacterium]
MLGYVGFGVGADLDKTPALAEHIDPALEPSEARLRASLLLARQRFVPAADEEFGTVAVLRAEDRLAMTCLGPLPDACGIWRRRDGELSACTQALKQSVIVSGHFDVARGDLFFLGLLDEGRGHALRSHHDAFGIAARCAQVPSPFVLVRVA